MDFNTRIAAYFLGNNRLTLLCFGLLVFLGFGATVLLKTTGFPSPDVKFVAVSTFYFGASAETVAEEVTAPLELILRDVDGVNSFSSTSSTSFSLISVSLQESADTDVVVSRLNSALSSITLPDGVEDPQVIAPDIAGPDLIFSLVSPRKENVYDQYQKIEEDLRALPETAEIAPLVSLEKRVVVTLDEKKLNEQGIRLEEIEFALGSLGETLPVTSDVTLDGKSTAITTLLKGNSLETLRALKFHGMALEDLAEIKVDYAYASQPVFAGFNISGDGFVFEPLVFSVKAVEGTDLGVYTQTLEDLFNSYEDLHLVYGNDFDQGFGKTLLVENYSANNDNERQVKEVTSGLIGEEWPGDGVWTKAGWLFGGVQLVFLVMIAFVSLRAAFVAVLAIPLSLVFVSIYLFFAGESLNTLVLFSLVLAIGLVVDPALVLLESIQRKVDTGLRGKEAALAAVQDVGMGLFLACLTSVIVFIPFAVVSGILGQIIQYIPMTVIPAVVGSYFVPLIFLAWFGGAFLKRKNLGTEEENIWGVAKVLMRFNEWVLRGPRIVRLLIISVAVLLPLMVAGYYFSSGQVKSVQFSSSDNADFLQLSYTHFPSTSVEDRQMLVEKAIDMVLDYPEVKAVFPLGEQNLYFVELLPALEREDTVSMDLAQEITQELHDELGVHFFDIQVGVLSNGPPGAAYQVTLSISSEDSQILRTAALDIGKTLKNVCKIDAVYTVAEECDEPVVVKVDDGYTGKESSVIEVILDREKLAEKQLLIPNAPLTLYVQSVLKNLFTVNGGDSVGTVSVDGENLEILLDQEDELPDSIQDIQNMPIVTFGGEVLRLRDIATIRVSQGPGSISRLNGETIAVVQARLAEDFTDQATAAQVTQAVLDHYQADGGEAAERLGLSAEDIQQYSEGDSASFIRSFQELFGALVLAILLTYVVLVVFFSSFTQPLVILFAVPLTFIGVFPALAHLSNGQFGFLEIIGLIILVGIVENVAIFLIDAANQKLKEGWDEIRAISYASGVRFRSVILTKMSTLASLAPLAVLSEQYRSLALVIMFGLLTSGFTSLITTPILFVSFRRLSRFIRRSK